MHARRTVVTVVKLATVPVKCCATDGTHVRSPGVPMSSTRGRWAWVLDDVDSGSYPESGLKPKSTMIIEVATHMHTP